MRRVRPDEVLAAVEEYTGFSPREPSRSRSVMRSRRLAIHAMREMCEMSMPEIARRLGYADHLTVWHHLHQPVDYDDLRAVVAGVARMHEETVA